MNIYSSQTYQTGKKKKKARAIIGSDWLFCFAFGFFSLGALVLYILTEYGEKWNINIKDESDGPIWIVLVFSIIFGLVAIGFTISIIQKLIVNHKLSKAEKIGNDILGKVVDFKRDSYGKYTTSHFGYSYKIKTEVVYTYYAIIEYINEKGETVKYTDYTPLTKEQTNKLLEIKTVNLKEYKNVCILNHDFAVSGTTTQTDFVKEQNKNLVQEYGPIKRNYYATKEQRNYIISGIIVVGIMLFAAIASTLALYKISPFFAIPSILIPLFICVFYIILTIKCKRNYDCLKNGESQKAIEYSLSYSFPFGAQISLTFVNKNGEEKTCSAKINKFEYGKIKEAKELYVLVFNNHAFPDLDKLEEHMREIK